VDTINTETKMGYALVQTPIVMELIKSVGHAWLAKMVTSLIVEEYAAMHRITF
jgi:hypothetical protein